MYNCKKKSVSSAFPTPLLPCYILVGAQLCDCTAGTLTQCDTLTNDDAHLCPSTTASGPTESTGEQQETDDGENGTAAIRSVSATVFTYFMIVAYII